MSAPMAVPGDDFASSVTPPAARPLKVAPKHAAPKVSRLHRPIAALQHMTSTVTAPLSKEARSARALRKGVEAVQAAPKAPKAKKVAKTAMAAPKLVTVQIPDAIAVDGKGEATRTFRTVVGRVGGVTEKAGSALSEAFDASIWVQLFENEEQRSRRFNAQAVAQTLILAAGLAARIAKK